MIFTKRIRESSDARSALRSAHRSRSPYSPRGKENMVRLGPKKAKYTYHRRLTNKEIGMGAFLLDETLRRIGDPTPIRLPRVKPGIQFLGGKGRTIYRIDNLYDETKTNTTQRLLNSESLVENSGYPTQRHHNCGDGKSDKPCGCCNLGDVFELFIDL